jgi:hypothetical protein
MQWPQVDVLFLSLPVSKDPIKGGEPMAYMPEVACEKIFLAHGIHCCPNFYPDQPYCIIKCIYMYEGTEIVYDHDYYQMMLQVNNSLIQSRSAEKLLVA